MAKLSPVVDSVAEKCVNCQRCISVCPVKFANDASGDTVKVNHDRCIGCGQCYTVCKDAGGWALEWDAKKRRPVLDEKKCLSCMVCSFACPVDGLITFKEMSKTYRRADTVTLGRELESQLKA